MLKFTHEDIAAALGAAFTFSGKAPDGSFGITTDTRKLEPGDLFVGIRGGNTKEVAEKALTAKACACILSCEAPEGLACYRVVDTIKALQDLAAYQRARVQIPMIGVTGSCGKTTTKNMLGSILKTLGETLVTEGNLNNEIGLPITLLKLSEEHRSAVVEMGMNHKGEILSLSRLARPDAAVITNIGSAHIEYLGSKENIALAKAEIFRGVPPCGKVALPIESDFFGKLSEMAKQLGLAVISFGKGGDFEFVIKTEDASGLSGELRTPMGNVALTVPVIGAYNALNIASAAAGACALIEGIKLENIKLGLESVKGEKLRNELHEHKGARFILDCYNANPDSMAASLTMLKEMDVKGRKAALLGDMLEIGDKAKGAHYEIGKFAAQFLDALFLTGEYAEDYAAGAKAAGSPCRVAICEPKDVLEALKAYVKADDAILFKGSRANKLEEYFYEMFKNNQ
ncbi:UDP-N-acetylmuramoyl-tripeptide--D-alanyl-D-alanine ligase [bacterium]|nr:UDP-N-acetylmuramoyl-tripeptide--D-alanyl-D-alanine ligase [bacterium]